MLISKSTDVETKTALFDLVLITRAASESVHELLMRVDRERRDKEAMEHAYQRLEKAAKIAPGN